MTRETVEQPRRPGQAIGRDIKASSIRVTGQHVYWVYGLLVARLRRDVSWQEFSELTGISDRQVRYMRFNEHPGGMRTAKKLLTLRNHGLMIHLSDFLATPETELHRLPIPGQRRRKSAPDYSQSVVPPVV